jgi:BTB/POZ domain
MEHDAPPTSLGEGGGARDADTRELHAIILAQGERIKKLEDDSKQKEKAWECRLERLEKCLADKSFSDSSYRPSEPIQNSRKCLRTSRAEEHSDEYGRREPGGSDVLHLNVGGSKQIAVFRSTLMCLEGSMLATRFSGRWDDILEKDRDGNFFIDQPADLFVPMIEFLQCKAKETLQPFSSSFPSIEDFGGSFGRFKKFVEMVEYYGMTSIVLPPRIRLLSTKHRDSVRISGHYIDARDHIMCDLVTWPWEPRRIQSFEVTNEAINTLKVGWMMGTWDFPDASKQPESLNVPIGTMWGSIGYCCVGNVVQYLSNDIFGPSQSRNVEAGMSVQAGCSIRCERRGSNFTWSAGGKAFTHDPGFSDNSNHLSYYRVPAFSGRGKWWISNIRYEETLS